MMADRDIDKAWALVIDSNATSRSVMAAQLRDLGVGTVKQTARVNDARLMLEHKPYDIVLCDYHFEGTNLSGQDLLDELRRENLLPYSTVFVMVTGEATYAKVMEAAESALDCYLLKPYTADALRERLTEARRRKRVLKDVFDALERRDTDRALTLCVHRFSKREPYWHFCARVAAELLINANRPADARKIYQAVQRDRPTPWALLGMARSQYLSGEIPAAKRALEDLMVEQPQYTDAHDLMARIQIDQGDYSAALSTYRIAVGQTPGCLLRMQNCGTLAHYQGFQEEAVRLLDRTAAIGMRSKLFDPLSLMLLALIRFDMGDLKALAAAHELIKRYAERHASPDRLRRFDEATRALRALGSNDPDLAAATIRLMAAEMEHEHFDLEAGTLIISLCSRMPQGSLAADEANELAHAVAMRFCVSKAVTEMLVSAAGRASSLVEVIRQGHAEITSLAEKAMNHSVRGEPRKAAEALLSKGAATRNAKLIEMAGAVVRRHREAIDDSEMLLEQASTLQQRYCQPHAHLAGLRRHGRSPGGLVLRA